MQLRRKKRAGIYEKFTRLIPKFRPRIRDNCHGPAKKASGIESGKRQKETLLLKSLVLLTPLTFIQVPNFEYKDGIIRYTKSPMYIRVQGQTDLTPRRFEGREISLPKSVEIEPPAHVNAKAETSETAEIKTREITVHFGLNSAVLSISERKRLNALQELFQKAEEIEITGYTCRLGTKAYNDRLALLRAENVRRYLVSNLGKEEKMTKVKGLGKCCYVSRSNTHNRRSVVRVVFKEEAPETHVEGGEPNGQS